MIKVFFAVLVLCTAAIVIVALAMHRRINRHLNQEPGVSQRPPEAEIITPVVAPSTKAEEAP